MTTGPTDHPGIERRVESVTGTASPGVSPEHRHCVHGARHDRPGHGQRHGNDIRGTAYARAGAERLGADIGREGNTAVEGRGAPEGASVMATDLRARRAPCSRTGCARYHSPWTAPPRTAAADGGSFAPRRIKPSVEDPKRRVTDRRPSALAGGFNSRIGDSGFRCQPSARCGGERFRLSPTRGQIVRSHDKLDAALRAEAQPGGSGDDGVLGVLAVRCCFPVPRVDHHRPIRRATTIDRLFLKSGIIGHIRSVRKLIPGPTRDAARRAESTC